MAEILTENFKQRVNVDKDFAKLSVSSGLPSASKAMVGYIPR